jgi:glycosyltransferase involved in cell wall biosynthesis
VKIACVVQRYGPEIAGGSETHCRDLAERLSDTHQVTVLTSCARDYVTWANAFPAGEFFERGIRVLRFPVVHRRKLKAFADLSDEVFAGHSSHDRQDDWFRENGPEVPTLLEHLRQHGTSYDIVLFWAFRYYPSYYGVPIVADRAVLVPTAEADHAIDLNVLEGYFHQPRGYIFLTPEEEQLVATRAGGLVQPRTIIGTGLDPAPAHAGAVITHELSMPYVLYLGRIDRNKGCDTLLEYFQQFASGPDAPTLVLAGPAKMRIPEHPKIRPLGYVSNEVREALLAGAQALIVPSPYESLSIVLLEAWNHGIPALVNGRCRVLDGQVRRANGGLSFRSALEFDEALTYLLTHPAERAAMGRQGLAYVEREYRWPVVLGRVEALLQAIVAFPGHVTSHSSQFTSHKTNVQADL